MRRSNELERRLVEWADEYGGGKSEHIGWSGKSFLETMIKYAGRAPDGLNQISSNKTPADEVEAAVSMLQKQTDGYAPAEVIRAEYFLRNCAEQHKLQELRKVGLTMGRTRYYDELWVARTHVAAWLRIPASVEITEVLKK